MLHTFRNALLLLCISGIFFPQAVHADIPRHTELRVQNFFPIELKAGDKFVFQNPTDSLIVTGPAVLEWNWTAGKLFCESLKGTACIRPLMAFPHQKMTPEMIERARKNFVDVPFIENKLKGKTNPSDQEWSEAYLDWLNEIKSLRVQYQTYFKDHCYENSTVVLEKILSELNSNKLVVPGSVKAFSPEKQQGFASDIHLMFKGVPMHENGTPDEWVISLRSYDQHNPPPKTSISRQEALNLHHAINTLFENSTEPVVLDLSSGTRISVKKGRD